MLNDALRGTSHLDEIERASWLESVKNILVDGSRWRHPNGRKEIDFRSLLVFACERNLPEIADIVAPRSDYELRTRRRLTKPRNRPSIRAANAEAKSHPLTNQQAIQLAQDIATAILNHIGPQDTIGFVQTFVFQPPPPVAGGPPGMGGVPAASAAGGHLGHGAPALIGGGAAAAGPGPPVIPAPAALVPVQRPHTVSLKRAVDHSVVAGGGHQPEFVAHVKGGAASTGNRWTDRTSEDRRANEAIALSEGYDHYSFTVFLGFRNTVTDVNVVEGGIHHAMDLSLIHI